MAKVTKTPLQGAQIKSLEAVGIKGLKTLEDAKSAVIKRLEKHDLDASVIEDEELEILIDMLSEFETGEEEEELDELVEELEEEEEIEEEEDEEFEEEEDEELDEEEEEEEAPIQKKPTPKIPVGKTATPALAAKTNKAVAKVVASKGGDDKFNGREEKSHLTLLKPFKEYFPEADGFQFDILKQGFTVRMVTGNTKQTIFNFDGLRIVDGSLHGALFCNRFKNVEELVAIIPEDYHDHEIGMFRGESHPCIRKVTTEDVIRILEETSFIEVSLKKAGSIDKRMVDNRQKLENTLTKTEKPAAKVVAAAAVKKPVTAAPAVAAKKTVVVKKAIVIKKK